MINKIHFHINELNSMKKYPNDLYYIGKLELLKKKKISLVGSRKPNQYSKMLCHEICTKLAKENISIVSGGAIGIDTISHKACGLEQTIMVAGTGLDKRYPSINKNMIEDIEKKGLVLSQFKEGTPSTRYNFPLRNELVVALGEVLIVPYADLNSGTKRSIDYALNMGKKIYVFPHRISESLGTNELIKQNLAEVIYDIDEFIEKFTHKKNQESIKDPFLLYCKSKPSLEDAIKKYGDLILEYELNNLIIINNGIVEIK